MELKPHWQEIKSTFRTCLASSKHCSVATVDAEGNPHITPIGFIFLKDDFTAYYFEEYSKSIPQNTSTNQNVCLMVVNSGFRYWLTSLFKGKFESAPGLRLYGTVGELRQATTDEINAYKKRVHSSRKLKGNHMLWQNLETVREITLTSFKPVTYPKMMSHLWKASS